jgi:hypothetical protein
LKSLLAGACLAAVSGLLMGSALRPNLRADDRPAGPQIVAGRGGDRAEGPSGDGLRTTLAAYGSAPPDYLLGTDWKYAVADRAWTGAVMDPAPAGSAEPTLDGDTPAVEMRDDANGIALGGSGERTRLAVTYPSVDGGFDLIPAPDESSE